MDFCKEHGEVRNVTFQGSVKTFWPFIHVKPIFCKKRRSEICKKIFSTFASFRFAIKMLDFPDRIQWQKTFLKLAEGVNEGNRMASNFSKTLVGPKLFNGGSPKPI